MDKEFISVKELMEVLSLSRTTVWSMIKKGQIPYYKFGGAYRFKMDEVLQFTKVDKNDESRTEVSEGDSTEESTD